MKLVAGTGFSGGKEAFAAGAEAASQAIGALGTEKPALVLVFTKPSFDLRALLDGIRSITGDTLLVGCTSAGEMIGGTYVGFGGGVGVTVFSAGDYRFGAASAANISDHLDEAGQTIVRSARQEAGRGKHGAVLLLADCLSGNLQKVFQGAYRITGPKVPIVGGAASDEMKFVKTLVFHNDQVIENGAVALWISSETPIKMITRHGWEPIGIPLLVTRADGVDIRELDGRPAAEVYEEQLGIAPGQLAADAFWATSVHHPLGLLQSDGSFIIRAARAKQADGALRIQGCVPPEGSAVQVMASSRDKLLDVVDEVGALASGPGDKGALIAFSCAARIMLLGDRIGEESRRLQSAAGDVPLFGLYCCGEFARTVGSLGTHNCTLTALAL